MNAWGVVSTAVVVTAATALVRPVRNAYITLSHVVRFRAVEYDFANPAAGYPIDSPSKGDEIRHAQFASPPFDSDGVPVVDYRWQRWHDMPKGRYYNAITIAQYALWGSWMRWLESGEDGLRDEFVAQCDWLTANQDPDGGYRNQFAHVTYNQPEGWLSAMGQGQASSALVRAWLLTGDDKYLESAKRAIALMVTPIENGGTLSVDDEGTWLEEVPEDPPSHVLNGLVFAWYGLHDLLCVMTDPALRSTHDAIIDTLASNIDRYDSDAGVRYELKRTHVVDRGNYMGLQIAQMHSLALMTGRPEFRAAESRWRSRYTPRTEISVTGRLARATIMALIFRLRQLKLLLKR